jgi:transposase
VEEKITISRREYEELKQENAELWVLVRKLQEEIALLKGGRNSHTSSTAPSQDIGRSNTNSLRVPSGKKPGGQLGHEGHSLQMSEKPDEIIDHKPQVCACCGASLQEVAEESYIPRQIVDIPPIRPVFAVM